MGTAALAIGHLHPSPSERPNHPRPSWAPCEHLPKRTVPRGCDGGCGTNTANINTFPIDGLHPGGCWNADDMRLVPGTLDAGFSRCPDIPLYLDVDAAGRFIGRDKSGQLKCQDAELVGATFKVEAWHEHDGVRSTRIMISQARAVQNKPGSITYPAFLLTPEYQSAATLCDAAYAGPWQSGWLSGGQSEPPARATPAVTAGDAKMVPSDALDRYAILIKGAIFDEKGDVMPLTPPAPGSMIDAQWFNIACSGAALARTELSGDAPSASSSLSRRKATLRMLTARYCGRTGYTVTGVPLRWFASDATEPAGLFPKIEARWDEHGAICLSHSRLWHANTVIPISHAWEKVCRDPENHPVPCPEQRFIDDISNIVCSRTLKPCDETRPATGVVWTTYAVDDVSQ